MAEEDGKPSGEQTDRKEWVNCEVDYLNQAETVLVITNVGSSEVEVEMKPAKAGVSAGKVPD